MKLFSKFIFMIFIAVLNSSVSFGAEVTADPVFQNSSAQNEQQSLTTITSADREVMPKMMDVASGTHRCCCGDGKKEPKTCADGPSGCACYCRGTPRAPVFECK